MKLKPGLVYGQALLDLYQYAKENKFALPAVNVIGTNSIDSARRRGFHLRRLA